MTREVTVIGGGLAGLTAALRLAGTGREVTVYDSREVLGGKARSIDAAADPATAPFHPYHPDRDLSWLTPTVDKGYHIFPAWYWELWHLVEEVGAGDNFYPRRRADGTDPKAGGYALFMPPLEDLSFRETDAAGPATRRSRTANMKTLIPRQWWRLWEWGPPLSMVLTAVGLAASSGRTVETMTVPDFISTRWYNGDARASVLQDMIVKALANPSKHTSAYTMRQMFRRWIPTVTSGNSWTPCRGPLQTCLIDPIVAACRDSGVAFQTDGLARLQRAPSGDIAALHFASGRVVDTADHDVVLAVPPDVLLDVIRTTPDLLGVRELGRLTHLRTAPMGALDLYFVDPATVDDYPPELTREAFTDRHFSLIESEFGLTGFPISDMPGWEPHLGGAPGLVLQFVCGNVLDIHELPVDRFARLLIDEIAEYLGFDPHRHLLGCVALPSSHEQLTMNDAGTWDKRPPADIKEIPNLFLAGDYVKLSVDVAGMEAAVESGANAARAILLAEHISADPPRDPGGWERCLDRVDAELPRPDELPPWYLRDVVYPVLRTVFVIVHYTLGWLVTLAKAPLVAGRTFVGELHDRYEDSREDEALAGVDGGSSLRRAVAQRALPVNVSKHQRRKGLGEPVGPRDRLLLFAGLIVVAIGFGSAYVLPLRLDDYSHIHDPISVLGRESATRPAYLAVTVVGWIGLQLFAAVVRKFMPGSQVLTWLLAWLGVLWVVVGLFPICPDALISADRGSLCPDGSALWWQRVHVAAAFSMALLLFAMPFFTWWQVLRRLPTGYEANWRGFRGFSGVMALATLASAGFFFSSLFAWNDWPSGLAQRVHWAVAHVWVVALALWIMLRRHRRADGSVAEPKGPLRAVDQRSLWA